MAAILCGLSGCQSPQAPFDPFLAGRTTIPPPATAVQQGAAPYYNGAPAATVAPSAMYTPPGSTPAAAPSASAPGGGSGFLPRGTSVPQSNNLSAGNNTRLAAASAAPDQYFDPQRPAEAKNANATIAAPSSTESGASPAVARGGAESASSGGVVPASYAAPLPESSNKPKPSGNDSPIRIVEPPARPKATAEHSGKLPAGTRSEAPLTASLRTPDARSPAQNQSAPVKSDQPEPTRPLQASSRQSPTVPGYGYDSRYTSLQGKLEYSPSQRRWKLRYIAVEGPTDAYGGSVVLAESDKLKGFSPGDFVTIKGRVLAAAEHAKGFSPTYAIDRIQRQ